MKRRSRAIVGADGTPAMSQRWACVPPDVIKAKIVPYRRRGKPWHRPGLQNLDDYDIVRIYGAEYRGVTGYYLLAKDAWRLRTLRWHAEVSMLRTLALKHQSTVSKMAARHKAKVITSDGPRTCFEARQRREGKADLVARFGGIPSSRTGARSSVTPPRPGSATPARSWSTGSSTGHASCASTAPQWPSTRSPRSSGSANQGRASPRGPRSW